MPHRQVAEDDYVERFHLRDLLEEWIERLKCDRPSDPYQFMIDEAQEQRRCCGGLLVCQNPWCGITMPAAEYECHLRTCDVQERWMRCVRCDERIDVSKWRLHRMHCRLQSCSYCGEVVLPRMLARCPYRLFQEAESTTRAQRQRLERKHQLSLLRQHESVKDKVSTATATSIPCGGDREDGSDGTHPTHSLNHLDGAGNSDEGSRTRDAEPRVGARWRAGETLTPIVAVKLRDVEEDQRSPLQPVTVSTPETLRGFPQELEGLVSIIQKLWRRTLRGQLTQEAMFAEAWVSLDASKESLSRTRHDIVDAVTDAAAGQRLLLAGEEEHQGSSRETFHRPPCSSDAPTLLSALQQRQVLHSPQSPLTSKRMNGIRVAEAPNEDGAYMDPDSLDNLSKLCAKRKPLSARIVAAIVRAATFILNGRSVVQHISIPEKGDVVVVGDLHGHLKDLCYLLQLLGNPSKEHRFIFNGDFTDRGPYGVEVIVYVFALLCTYPKYVGVNRGNHEDYHTNTEYGFMTELHTKFDTEATFIRELLTDSYQAMPLVTIIDKHVMVVHGGVPRDPCTLAEIEAIGRVRDIPVVEQKTRSSRILVDLLWNDPVEKYRSRQLGPRHEGHGWRSSKRGCGAEYTKVVTDRFLKDNQLDLVIRSHDVKLPGFELAHQETTITVFSASDYGGVAGNRAAVAVLTKYEKRPVFHTWFIKERGAGGLDLPSTLTLQPAVAPATPVHMLLSDKSHSSNGSPISHRQSLKVLLEGDEYVQAFCHGFIANDDDDEIGADPEAIAEQILTHSPSSSLLQNSPSFGAAHPPLSVRLHLSVIQEIRELIFVHRYALLSHFSTIDENRTGVVYKVEWCALMEAVLKIQLPWYFLYKFFTPQMEMDGIPCVEYMRFLLHFNSQFAASYLLPWQRSAVLRIFSNMDLPDDILSIFVAPFYDSELENLPLVGRRSPSHSLNDAASPASTRDHPNVADVRGSAMSLQPPVAAAQDPLLRGGSLAAGATEERRVGGRRLAWEDRAFDFKHFAVHFRGISTTAAVLSDNEIFALFMFFCDGRSGHVTLGDIVAKVNDLTEAMSVSEEPQSLLSACEIDFTLASTAPLHKVGQQLPTATASSLLGAPRTVNPPPHQSSGDRGVRLATKEARASSPQRPQQMSFNGAVQQLLPVDSLEGTTALPTRQPSPLWSSPVTMGTPSLTGARRSFMLPASNSHRAKVNSITQSVSTRGTSVELASHHTGSFSLGLSVLHEGLDLCWVYPVLLRLQEFLLGGNAFERFSFVFAILNHAKDGKLSEEEFTTLLRLLDAHLERPVTPVEAHQLFNCVREDGYRVVQDIIRRESVLLTVGHGRHRSQQCLLVRGPRPDILGDAERLSDEKRCGKPYVLLEEFISFFNVTTVTTVHADEVGMTSPPPKSSKRGTTSSLPRESRANSSSVAFGLTTPLQKTPTAGLLDDGGNATAVAGATVSVLERLSHCFGPQDSLQHIIESVKAMTPEELMGLPVSGDAIVSANPYILNGPLEQRITFSLGSAVGGGTCTGSRAAPRHAASSRTDELTSSEYHSLSLLPPMPLSFASTDEHMHSCASTTSTCAPAPVFALPGDSGTSEFQLSVINDGGVYFPNSTAAPTNPLGLPPLLSREASVGGSQQGGLATKWSTPAGGPLPFPQFYASGSREGGVATGSRYSPALPTPHPTANMSRKLPHASSPMAAAAPSGQTRQSDPHPPIFFQLPPPQIHSVSLSGGAPTAPPPTDAAAAQQGSVLPWQPISGSSCHRGDAAVPSRLRTSAGQICRSSHVDMPPWMPGREEAANTVFLRPNTSKSLAATPRVPVDGQRIPTAAILPPASAEPTSLSPTACFPSGGDTAPTPGGAPTADARRQGPLPPPFPISEEPVLPHLRRVRRPAPARRTAGKGTSRHLGKEHQCQA